MVTWCVSVRGLLDYRIKQGAHETLSWIKDCAKIFLRFHFGCWVIDRCGTRRLDKTRKKDASFFLIFLIWGEKCCNNRPCLYETLTHGAGEWGVWMQHHKYPKWNRNVRFCWESLENKSCQTLMKGPLICKLFDYFIICLWLSVIIFNGFEITISYKMLN